MKPEPRLRVGQRADDHHLVGVGHDDPLGRVGVVGGPAQHAASAARPGRSGPACPAPAGVAHEPRPGRPPPRPLRPSSRAFIAHDASPSVGPGTCSRPRSTVITKPCTASRAPGAVLVRGREPRPGRTRTSSSSSRACRLRSATSSGAARPSIAAQTSVKSGQVLAARGRRPRPARPAPPGRGRPPPSPSGGRRRSERPAVQRRGPDRQPVGRSSTSPPSALISLRQRGQPVGLVPAQVRRSRAAGDGRRPRRPPRRATGASSPTSRRSASTPWIRPVPVTSARPRRSSAVAPIGASTPRIASPAWVVRGRPVGNGHRAAGDQRGGQERGRVGQVGLDRHVDRGRAAPAAPARRRAGRQSLDQSSTDARPPAACARSSRCAAARAPAAPRAARRYPRRTRAPPAAGPRPTAMTPKHPAPRCRRGPRRGRAR